ncbi:hypothetical protein [Spirulina major]|uniref:hypothetical protein n=1 Tax=Spirulina major TaxID=270636 RepID=UPI001114E929|nr:hypothetical protein [Spirulina major]
MNKCSPDAIAENRGDEARSSAIQSTQTNAAPWIIAPTQCRMAAAKLPAIERKTLSYLTQFHQEIHLTP